MKHIGIIGGGASGMMAAVAAARSGAFVTILEKQDRIGKKILATGNGKCNLSNLSFLPKRDYHSQNPEKLSAYFERFSVSEATKFFEDCGLVLTDRNGYLYPRSGQASTVLNLFLELLEKYHVKVVTECQIQTICRRRNGEYEVHTDREAYRFDALILAAGSAAGTKEKDKLGGMKLAQAAGLKTVDMLPALTALRCQGDFWKGLAGVRCDGEIRLIVQEKTGKKMFSERGEIQLTDYGISGIPTFQLSRHASLALSQKGKVEAHLDFFPEVSAKEWRTYCEERVKRSKGRNVTAFLEGMVNKKIAQTLLKEAGVKASESVSDPMTKQFWRVLCLMKDFPVNVTETNPAANAQVCLGGVLLSQLDENLEAKTQKGLYVIGEMADVDGRCGGYNLQWAWTSGWIAGKAAGMVK